ncbi:MAG: DNA-binding response regulator [Planctomycetota bacterium]|nr:MAG: DNA-binding response regulator [Planctomycetota bacterium]
MTPTKQRTQILLVDDHPVVRHGLKQLLEQEEDLEVCCEAEGLEGALECIGRHQPHMAIVDLSLGTRDGLELLKEIQAKHSWLPVLVVSMHEESLYSERVLRAGALGYLNKQEATETIVPAVRRVLAGGIYLSEKVAERRAARRAAAPGLAPEASPLECLSDRELQVFRLIGQGETTRSIAEGLELSIKTIETYRAHIKSKLGLKHSTELLQHAFLYWHAGEAALKEALEARQAHG